jgi:hypothetical protein
MTAAILGLLGVIVGAIITGIPPILLKRRTDLAERRSAARLVRSELVRFRTLAYAAAQQSPENLPQLHEITPILWQGYQAVLARVLTDEDWVLVARAYAHVDALAAVLVFEHDGTLVDWRRREAQRLLEGMIAPVEQAATALLHAAGVSNAPPGREPEPPDFPEHGPVAA